MVIIILLLGMEQVPKVRVSSEYEYLKLILSEYQGSSWKIKHLASTQVVLKY